MIYPRTQRQEQLMAVGRELAEQFAGRAARYDEDGAFPHENFEALRARGLPGLVVPEALGGWGANLLESALAMETLAAGDGSTALAFVMHVQTLGSAIESQSWPTATLERICREVVDRGALINAIATEPQLGSPSRGGLPGTTATPIYAEHTGNGSAPGDGGAQPVAWILNGHKTFASLSPALDYYAVAAALQDGSGEEGRFVVPAGAHVEIEETWNAMGMRATGSHDIHLRNARVPAELMVSRRHPQALDPVRSIASAWFVVCVNAVYIGVAQAALDFAARFAEQRVPTALGKPIAELESIQTRLGRGHLLLTQARALLYSVADDWIERPDRRQELSPLLMAAKTTASNNAIEAVDQAMRVAGGASMTRALPLERHYRDVRAGLYHPMSDDQVLPMLGRALLARQPSTPAPAAEKA